MKFKIKFKLFLWLLKKKTGIYNRLAMCGEFIPRIKIDIDRNVNAFDEYVEREVKCLVDYIKLYLIYGKNEYRNLYIGERLKMSYDIDCSSKERTVRLIEFMKRDKEAFLNGILENDNEIHTIISNFFDDIISEFQMPISSEIRVLFIGDCLHQDVMGSLSQQIIKHGTSISTHIISTKNIFQLHKELNEFKSDQFDLIFFSPFTYNYNIDLSELLSYKNFFMPGFKFGESLADICAEVEKVINTISTVFDCTVFIHNTACILREESYTKFLVKCILTKRLRKDTSGYVDKRLRSFINVRNSTKFKQFFLLDELNVLKKDSLFQLGKFLYKSALQHPTKFGLYIAEEYDKILFLFSHLMGKKLVVCDLDNTLWDGVIGEGKVEHFIERQEILLRLKSSGILLAINSKNDPKNINWDGGVLSDKDFVFQSVNWEPKINAFPQMQQRLNLKIKDFIFIDDRLDELELVEITYHEVKCFDATVVQTWDILKLWADIMDDAHDLDRTQMYLEREYRESFVKETDGQVIDEEDAFEKLNLVLTLKIVKTNELKRAVELINRTNQFNMRGSRTTFSEAKKWLASENITVLQASMADKFGDMGVVSIIVYEKKNKNINILIFVLSCRVFGYDVEVAILNQVKRFAQEAEVDEIIGEYIETASNKPCSLVYSKAGFVKELQGWRYALTDSVGIRDPKWLKIIPRQDL